MYRLRASRSDERGSGACPRCNSEWQEARYDYPAFGSMLSNMLTNRPFDLWRYKELLAHPQPVECDHNGRRRDARWLHGYNLGLMLGRPYIYVKDERQGPTRVV